MTRMEDMVRMYGEVCNKSKAARILGVDRASIYRMINDGRLQTACGGTSVDVRSICRFIEGGKQ